jgi:hypothetical protein
LQAFYYKIFLIFCSFVLSITFSLLTFSPTASYLAGEEGYFSKYKYSLSPPHINLIRKKHEREKKKGANAKVKGKNLC